MLRQNILFLLGLIATTSLATPIEHDSDIQTEIDPMGYLLSFLG
jgi:hypothetical protein